MYDLITLHSRNIVDCLESTSPHPHPRHQYSRHPHAGQEEDPLRFRILAHINTGSSTNTSIPEHETCPCLRHQPMCRTKRKTHKHTSTRTTAQAMYGHKDALRALRIAECHDSQPWHAHAKRSKHRQGLRSWSTHICPGTA